MSLKNQCLITLESQTFIQFVSLRTTHQMLTEVSCYQKEKPKPKLLTILVSNFIRCETIVIPEHSLKPRIHCSSKEFKELIVQAQVI